jgi:23S rRNA G2445 N2-methylase RlmL
MKRAHKSVGAIEKEKGEAQEDSEREKKSREVSGTETNLHHQSIAAANAGRAWHQDGTKMAPQFQINACYL